MLDMLDTNRAYISKVVLHRVGHKIREEKNIEAQDLLTLTDYLNEVLKNYFLNPFKKELMTYEFTHPMHLDFNEVYQSCEKIFADERTFLDASQEVLKTLYEQSTHPSIKLGELFVVHFGDVMYNDILTEAVGIFKVERKNKFFNFIQTSNGLELELRNGFNSQKIDKAALVLNRVSDKVHTVFSIDNNNYDTTYWKNHFLDIEPIDNHQFQTDHYLSLCKDFSKDLEMDFGRKEQAEFLGKTLQYFRENISLDDQEFKEEVIGDDPKMLEAFNWHQKEYAEIYDMHFWKKFEIAQPVFKSQLKTFKTEIKLDTKIKISLDNNALEEAIDHIEKGYDDSKKMNYYKVYFNDEI